MQCVRPVSQCASYSVRKATALLSLLVALIALGTNSHAASRDSCATLHIRVTLVTTIAAPAPEQIQPTEVATSENPDITYNLRPPTGQSAEEGITRTSQRESQESLANLDNPSKEESVVEVTTVVMK